MVVATGNGTAGAFAPQLLQAVGCEVVPLHSSSITAFRNYNPNPEDLEMLHDVAAAVTANGADIGLAFDGDGDRCGVVDNRGHEIFADKVGVLLARDLAVLHANARFVVDVKSTGLYATDPLLKQAGAITDYWKTGHSYIKRRVNELNAVAGFEKSGHFFFNVPPGRGYDDGLIAALAICDMLDRNPGRSIADLHEDLTTTWNSPTMSAHCPDEVKYGVADRVRERIERIHAAGEPFAGHPIAGVVTVNGIRVVAGDGTWGLVRASSNKPELVVVVESPSSAEMMKAMFRHIDTHLAHYPDVGAYNQKIA